MGSNMAENHPVGFQWVMAARERGAEVIHIDPRFTRTSAVATQYVALRAGTDIAFLGGVINYILTNGREFREYVEHYTNAATIVDERFVDADDENGYFSGFDADTRQYDPETWSYASMPERAAAGDRADAVTKADAASGAEHPMNDGRVPLRDPSLQHPRCVFQLLKKHYARYTPEMVARICGVPESQFTSVAETLCANSGRERTTAFAYAVGWTHHTTGVQYIRTAAIVQLLLGNIGRPGGGILALRGHASIQGSTDIPTLYNMLPGYLPAPFAAKHETIDDYVATVAAKTGYWGYAREYLVSLLKAYFGDAATAENDYLFGLLPRIDGDHSAFTSVVGMLEGWVRGYFIVGENPVVGNVNGGFNRKALANLEWLVVRDLFEIESASFWYNGPEIDSGELVTERIKTEVFFLPAAAHTEKSGSVTNTQRLLQWHHEAVEPQGDCRSELGFYYHLGRRIKEKLAASTDPRDRPIQALTWQYGTHGSLDEPNAHEVLREINGRKADGTAVSAYTELRADGSTACGCWIYAGAYADDVNQVARRKPGSQQDWVAAEWGWAWPANRRLLYNRASADPAGKPWSERKKYVWWDEGKQTWTGHDVPDFTKTMRPDHVPAEGQTHEQGLRGDAPFIMQADGLGWLYVPTGIGDGPFPSHYEPQETPVENALHPGTRSSPTRQLYDYPGNAYNPSGDDPGSERYPFVMTTYRVTEHHTGGAMTRNIAHLNELQPAMFCEVSPELAALRGLENGGYATIVSSRSAIEARVLVTKRIAPIHLDGRVLHMVGLPYHWGAQGEVTGDSANDLFAIVTDPDVHIHETKAATCDIRPGRRPRGAALPAFVEAVRMQAVEERT
jgi:formate dehydrogenase major subunit